MARATPRREVRDAARRKGTPPKYIGQQCFHVLDLAKRPDIHLIVELAALIGVRALTILTDEKKAGNEYCFDRKNDSQKSERIDIEHP